MSSSEYVLYDEKSPHVSVCSLAAGACTCAHVDVQACLPEAGSGAAAAVAAAVSFEQEMGDDLGEDICVVWPWIGRGPDDVTIISCSHRVTCGICADLIIKAKSLCLQCRVSHISIFTNPQSRQWSTIRIYRCVLTLPDMK